MANKNENKCLRCKNYRYGQCAEDKVYCPTCRKCVECLDDDYARGYGESIYEIHKCPECRTVLGRIRVD